MTDRSMIDRVARRLWRAHTQLTNLPVLGDRYVPTEGHYDYHASAPHSGPAFVALWEGMAREAIDAVQEETSC